MIIKEIELENYRCFKGRNKIVCSESINLFVGKNNAGKSSVLKTILFFQTAGLYNSTDTTKKESNSSVNFKTEGIIPGQTWSNNTSIEIDYIEFRANLSKGSAVVRPRNSRIDLKPLGKRFPNNGIYTFLSKRKVISYDFKVDSNNTNEIKLDLSNLPARVHKFYLPHNENNKRFMELSEELLGFKIAVETVSSGMQVGKYIEDGVFVPLENMGDGVANILGLLVSLLEAENKIFVIEELENDLHPEAIKLLLDLIIEKSSNNQFFISTHSNIVLNILGGQEKTKVFKISKDIGNEEAIKIGLSNIKELSSTLERQEVLEELGYELSDFNLWDGWLFLEESSIETIINKYLIPWYVPELIGKIRTFSSGGYTGVRKKFEAFKNVFVFVHLNENYQGKAWVVLDGGENEEKVIKKMQNDFKDWGNSHFRNLKYHDFEDYYPQSFEDKIDKLKKFEGEDKRKAKRKLLLELIDYIENSDKEDIIKNELASCFQEIISILKDIKAKLIG